MATDAPQNAHWLMTDVVMQIRDYSRRVQKEALPVPQIHVVGLQSTGKTTLVEVILGSPYGHKDISTATRCPQILQLVRNSECMVPKVTVNGETVDYTCLPDKVRKIMVQISQEARFSPIPVEIKFESKDVPDLVLVDHIGLRTALGTATPEFLEDAEKIKLIAAEHLRSNADSAIVACFNCPTGMDGFTDHKFLEEVLTGDNYDSCGPKRSQWTDHALIVVNYFNQKSSNFLNMGHANAFFKAALSMDNINLHFVSLKPDDSVDPDNASFEERRKHLHHLEEKEQTFIKELKTKLASATHNGDTWNSQNDEILGIGGAKQKINGMWQSVVLRNLPRLIECLQKEAADVRQELQKLPDSELFSPEHNAKLRRLLNSYVVDFFKQVTLLHQGHMAKDAEGRDVTTKGDAGSSSLYTPSNLGKTFFEEVQSFVPEGAGELLEAASQAEASSGDMFGTQLRLQGQASFRRIMQVFDFVLLKKLRDADGASNDDILIMATNLRSPSVFPENDVVMQLAADQFHRVSKNTEWLVKFLENLFLENLTAVHSHLQRQPEYKAVSYLRGFPHLLSEAYHKAICERLKFIQERWADLVASKIGSRRQNDLFKPLLALAALNDVGSSTSSGRHVQWPDVDFVHCLRCRREWRCQGEVHGICSVCGVNAVEGRLPQAAILNVENQISYRGHIREELGGECIGSFPGKYGNGWRGVTSARHGMSVACVFLTSPRDGLGKHAQDPASEKKACYCPALYGRRGFKKFGYLLETGANDDPVQRERKERQAEATGAFLWDREEGMTREAAEAEARKRWKSKHEVASWGCEWFAQWVPNIEKALKMGQKIVVYYFENQVSKGKVFWEDLSDPDVDPWDGVGLGGSQKCEVAYLDHKKYAYEERDVMDFIRRFGVENTLSVTRLGKTQLFYESLLQVCRDWAGYVELSQVVLGGARRAMPQAQAHVDFDHIRKSAKFCAIQMVLEIQSVFADLLETRFLQELMDFDKSEALKGLLSVPDQISAKQWQAINPDELRQRKLTLETSANDLNSMLQKVKIVLTHFQSGLLELQPCS